MTEDRKNLIEDMQKLIDVNPRKSIFAALMANIAEDYAEHQVKKTKVVHKIKWVVKPQRPESNVTTIHGTVNDILMFEISQFKNDKFEDKLILTSKVIPMNMKQNENLDDIKAEAWGQYKKFLETIS